MDGLSQQELGLSELVCHKTRQRQLLSQSCLLPDVTVGLAKDAGVAEEGMAFQLSAPDGDGDGHFLAIEDSLNEREEQEAERILVGGGGDGQAENLFRGGPSARHSRGAVAGGEPRPGKGTGRCSRTSLSRPSITS